MFAFRGGDCDVLVGALRGVGLEGVVELAHDLYKREFECLMLLLAKKEMGLSSSDIANDGTSETEFVRA